MLDNRFALMDTLKCSSLALALFVVIIIFPVGGIVVCLVPALIAVATYRNSLKMGVWGALLVIIGSAFLLGLGGLIISIELCAMGLLIGELMRRKVQPAYVIIFASVLFVAIFIGYILVSGQTSMQLALDDMLETYKQMLLQDGGAMIDMIGGEEYLNTVILTVRRAFPSFLVIFAALCAYVNYFFAGNRLMKMYLKRQTPMLAEFTLPGNIYMGIIIIMAFSLLTKAVDFQYSGSLFLNLSMVFSMLFYLQGFSCIYHFLMTRMSPGLRNATMVALVVFLPLYTVVELVGFIDAGFNLRRLNR